VGTVEVGKVADLLLVDGDPLTDLRRLSTPRTVIQAGSIVG
jgi:imidazolonepropionase-like amidohydrolase